jgi:hypothetical protein
MFPLFAMMCDKLQYLTPLPPLLATTCKLIQYNQTELNKSHIIQGRSNREAAAPPIIC